jgi:hypothetical protein
MVSVASVVFNGKSGSRHYVYRDFDDIGGRKLSVEGGNHAGVVVSEERKTLRDIPLFLSLSNLTSLFIHTALTHTNPSQSHQVSGSAVLAPSVSFPTSTGSHFCRRCAASESANL